MSNSDYCYHPTFGSSKAPRINKEKFLNNVGYPFLEISEYTSSIFNEDANGLVSFNDLPIDLKWYIHNLMIFYPKLWYSTFPNIYIAGYETLIKSLLINKNKIEIFRDFHCNSCYYDLKDKKYHYMDFIPKIQYIDCIYKSETGSVEPYPELVKYDI